MPRSRPARAKAAAPALPVPQSAAEADDAIRRIGVLQDLVEVAQISHADRVREIEAATAARIQPLADEIAALTAGLRTWAEAHRSALQQQAGGGKTILFCAGAIRWRARPPKVTLKGGAEAIIARIRALALFQFLRTKIEIDREAMLREPALAASIEGVAIGSGGEDFEVLPNRAAVAALPETTPPAGGAGIQTETGR